MSDLPDNYAVSVSDVKNWEEKNGKIRKGDIALFYFGRSASHLAEDFPGVSKEAGDYLAEKGVKMVGADTCAPDPYNVWHPDPGRKGLPLHESLLPRGIIIMEGLANLDKLPPRGAYFIGFPLKIKGGSGSPLRAVALVQKG
jgi:kynurenine formamidase